MIGMRVGTKHPGARVLLCPGREYTLSAWFLFACVCIFILTMKRRGGGEDDEILSWLRCRAGAHRELGISERTAQQEDVGLRQEAEAGGSKRGHTNFSCPKLELRLLLDTGEKRRSRS